ncbi:MAG: hypothetical protein P1P84_15535 [Deferrisomatales bacterium]|nr:hypothetical protein [Deferrisomatales bacterium]
MDIQTAWDNLAAAIAAMHQPDGDYWLKLDTVGAGVVLLFEFPAEQILAQVENSALPTRATVSWLVFEAGRLPGVDAVAARTLAALYEDTAPAGEGLIAPPQAWARTGTC